MVDPRILGIYAGEYVKNSYIGIVLSPHLMLRL
jgi:hypothetical protein